MRERLSKVSVLFLALVLALGGIGAAFASWTDTLTISGDVTTGVLEWEIVPGSQSQKTDDPDWNCFFDLNGGSRVQVDKDVATTTVVIEDTTHPHSMTVTLDNAYPYYYDHIAFQVHGLGTIPLRFWKINLYVDDTLKYTMYTEDWYKYLDLDGDGENDLEIWWGDHMGWQFHNCTTVDLSFDLLVLQPAPQNAQLSFTIELVGIQWNEYVQGPLP